MELLNESKKQVWLIFFFRGLLILVFLTLFARVVDLQVIRGKYFKSLSEDNRVRSIPLIAMRGNILARGGEVIVGSQEIKKKIIFDPQNGYQKEEATEGGGLDLISEWVRNYETKEKFAHITGYLGEINSEEVGKVEAKCIDNGVIRLGELIGRSGLEEEYDCLLRGINGEELIEVDAMGKMVRTLGRKNPVPGTDLKTTLDFGLQTFASDLLKDKKGAIIATDKNGEILAFVSSPSYDPNLFTVGGDSIKVTAILNDKSLPLLNRAISGKYHPGSIYKPIVAMAALEEGVIDENYFYEDTGSIVINSIYGDSVFSNWYYLQYGGREGNINLVKALARSTDTFFYKIGEITGIDPIVRWSHLFGLGETTKIDIPGEAIGLIPDPIWKERVIKERWYLGNTYNMSIGQGDLLVTPIGIHTAILGIAGNGRICKPSFLSDENAGNCKELPIKKENIDLVKKGMIAVCSDGGTAYTFFDFNKTRGIEVACKTGTAQNANLDPHAWFTAFAPVNDPEIVLTVLVEEGGEGSKVAGPIAREIFNYWFDNR